MEKMWTWVWPQVNGIVRRAWEKHLLLSLVIILTSRVWDNFISIIVRQVNGIVRRVWEKWALVDIGAEKLARTRYIYIYDMI
jgi:hypothetical protein